jgi:hypothetical protein
MGSRVGNEPNVIRALNRRIKLFSICARPLAFGDSIHVQHIESGFPSERRYAPNPYTVWKPMLCYAMLHCPSASGQIPGILSLGYGLSGHR